MFQDKDVDPRDCTYRVLATSRLRKQMDRLLRSIKIELKMIPKPRDPSESYYDRPTSAGDTTKNLVNRNAKNKKNQTTVDDQPDDNDDTADLSISQRIQMEKVNEIEEILYRVDEEQKQTYTYEDVSRLHRLLQHLDTEMIVATQYFFDFFEENFRVAQQPERRKNPELDERIRKLKVKSAANDYDSMISNVAQKVLGKRTAGFLGDEFRTFRSTIVATINALMVIGATFLFCYVAFRYTHPEYDTAKIVLYSFCTSMVVAIAEIYFLIRIV